MCFSFRFFGVPVSRFYDDEGVFEPSYAAGSGKLCNFDFRELIWFHFDCVNHVPWRPDPVYCGVRTD